MKQAETLLEKFVFASRWIQAPIYLGLIVGSVLYTYKFMQELLHLLFEVHDLSEEALMLGILTLVDVSMVMNLLVMVVIGGWATFVSHMDLEHHEDRPDWLEKINAGTLKVKLAASLVGISGIHLLKAFINITQKTDEQVMWLVIIHVVFLLTTLVLAYTEKILHSTH